MKNPLLRLVAEYPNNKIQFVWKNDGQMTHIIVDEKRLGIKGLARSIFTQIQTSDVSLDEELYSILKRLIDSLIKYTPTEKK